MEEITTDVTHHSKAYAVFINNTEDGPDLVRWLRENILAIVKRCHGADMSKPLWVLSVGCGDGNKDSVILDELLSKYQVVHYSAIEPAKEHLTTFQNEIVQNPKYTTVTFYLHNMKAEEYVAKHIPTKFHLIHFLHVLYYVDNIEFVLKSYNTLLDSSGCMLNYMANFSEGIGLLWEEFKDELSSSPGKGYVSSSFVDEALKKLLYNHTKTTIASRFDVSSIFSKNEEGELLLDFISGVKNFRKTAPCELYRKLIERIRELSIIENEQIILYNLFDAHLILKSSIKIP